MYIKDCQPTVSTLDFTGDFLYRPRPSNPCNKSSAWTSSLPELSASSASGDIRTAAPRCASHHQGTRTIPLRGCAYDAF